VLVVEVASLGLVAAVDRDAVAAISQTTMNMTMKKMMMTMTMTMTMTKKITKKM
jgi:metal-sulfur cluster biosynthetic enzyme